MHTNTKERRFVHTNTSVHGYANSLNSHILRKCMSTHKVSKFAQYKEETGTTPLPTFIDTALFDITKKLASEQKITHAAWVRRALTVAVNEQGIEYVYPEKESLEAELARVKAELAALKSNA